MLLLVVGPTGAGKDTLLAQARRQLAGDRRFHFVRRVISCPPDPGNVEDFESCDERSFLIRRDAGGFAVSWRAYGFFYGLPADIELDGYGDRVGVANVPRSLVAELAGRCAVRVIEVTAPAEILARRLAAVGRLDAVDAARRLSRGIALPPGVPKEGISNDGTPEQGGRRLVAALIRAAAAAPPA